MMYPSSQCSVFERVGYINQIYTAVDCIPLLEPIFASRRGCNDAAGFCSTCHGRGCNFSATAEALRISHNARNRSIGILSELANDGNIIGNWRSSLFIDTLNIVVPSFERRFGTMQRLSLGQRSL